MGHMGHIPFDMETHLCPTCQKTIPMTIGRDGKSRRTHKFCSPACACWFYIDKSGGPDACWPWTSYTNQTNYGIIGWGRKDTYLAHRVLYEDFYKTTIGPLNACHKCDNPLCCNPTHIFLGTQQDNLADMTKKGRRVPIEVKRGSSHYLTKLTEADVLAMRSSNKPARELASAYGMSISGIESILSRRSWKHI